MVTVETVVVPIPNIIVDLNPRCVSVCWFELCKYEGHYYIITGDTLLVYLTLSYSTPLII